VVLRSMADKITHRMHTKDDGEESMLNKLKDKVTEVHSSFAEKITDASGTGMEKLQEVMEEVDEISPLIRELGYTVESINVEAGLIPSISIDIGGMTKTMPEETYQRILEEQKDRGILVSVIKTLQSVSALQQKIHFMGMRSDNATITLGLPPKVSLKFMKTN
jgi:hypothetical protein